MKKIWINKARSFKEMEEFDREYYFRMSPEQRLDIIQQLREMYRKNQKRNRRENRTRLRRIVKVIQ